MRIGLLANIGPTLDAFFPELVQEWENIGHAVFMAAGSPARSLNNEVLRSATRRPSIKNFCAHRDLTRWIIDNKLDLIVTNNATTSVLSRFRKLPVPVVYFCHGLHWNQGTTVMDRLWQSIEKLMLRNTRAVLCMNTDDLDWFGTHFDRHRIHYLSFGVGVPLDTYKPTPLPDTNILQLVWAGEFSDRKRPELVLKVAQHLRDAGMPFHLSMLGQGARHEEIRSKIHELGLGELVTVPGFASVPLHLKQSHALVHTSLWEGLPRIMLEARAMRRHSIAFDVKGVRDIPDAILIPDGDTHAFAKKLQEYGRKLDSQPYMLEPVTEEMDSKAVARSISGFLENVL